MTFATTARAQSGAARAHTAVSTSEAREAFERGLALADRGDWRGAIDALERARALGATPAVHFNLAIAYRTTGRAADAASALDAFFDSAGDGAPPALLAQARTQLAQLRARLCAISVHSERRTTRLTIDERAVDADAVRHWVSEGAHTVRAESGDGVARTRSIHCTRGESLALPLRWLDAERSASLTVEVEPRAALVRIDGLAIGHGAIDEQLSEGEHRVEVTLADHQRFERVVRLRAGRSQRVRVELSPQPSVARSPWLWTGVGAVVLGATITAVVLATRVDPPFEGIAANVEALTWR